MRWLIVFLLLSGCASVKPWTAEEKVLLGVSCIATVADTITTIRMLDDGGWETNPYMGKHPSDSQVIITMGVVQLLTIGLSHWWDDFRSWILGVKTGVNVGFAFINERNH